MQFDYLNGMNLKSQTNFEVSLIDILDLIDFAAGKQLDSVFIFFVDLHYQILTAFEWNFLG